MTSSPGANPVTPDPTSATRPREVAALAGRKGGGEHLLHRAVADDDLAGIDARGGDPDQNLPVTGRRARDIDDTQDVRRPVMVELHPATHWFTSGAGSSRRVSAMTGIVRLVFCWYPANPG